MNMEPGTWEPGNDIYNKNPAIVAVTKLASVPANIARKPRRARS